MDDWGDSLPAQNKEKNDSEHAVFIGYVLIPFALLTGSLWFFSRPPNFTAVKPDNTQDQETSVIDANESGIATFTDEERIEIISYILKMPQLHDVRFASDNSQIIVRISNYDLRTGRLYYVNKFEEAEFMLNSMSFNYRLNPDATNFKVVTTTVAYYKVGFSEFWVKEVVLRPEINIE